MICLLKKTRYLFSLFHDLRLQVGTAQTKAARGTLDLQDSIGLALLSRHAIHVRRVHVRPRDLYLTRSQRSVTKGWSTDCKTNIMSQLLVAPDQNVLCGQNGKSLFCSKGWGVWQVRIPFFGGILSNTFQPRGGFPNQVGLLVACGFPKQLAVWALYIDLQESHPVTR